MTANPDALPDREAVRSIVYQATHEVLPLADDVTGLGSKARAKMQVEIADRILALLGERRGQGSLPAEPVVPSETVDGAALIPRVWVVVASQGEYSDRAEWVVEAHTTEAAGQEAVERLDAERMALRFARPQGRVYGETTHYLSECEVTAPPAPSPATADSAGQDETWETMATWTAETFGDVTLERIATRANEEMQELLADPSDVTEAADVCIVLSRYPGIREAINRKMAVNRSREWRLMGDGSGYHVKSPTAAQGDGE